MNESGHKIAKRRARSSYLSTTVGITLVLFMLGILVLLLLNAKKINTQLKEDLKLQIYLKKGVNEVNRDMAFDIIRTKKQVNDALLISADEAADQMKAEFGEDFITKLDGENPLPHSIEVSFKENYIQKDSLNSFNREVMELEQISDTTLADYENISAKIESNIKKAGWAMLILSGLLLLIAFALINNTIRLSIYAKRFVIRSMQLIGARPGFIQKPFILNGLWQGFASGILAIGLLLGLMFALDKYLLPGFIQFQDLTLFVKLFSLIIVLGIAITLLSTIF
ncbi:MAG: permease-like cell division protein FtsX, partial [Bacteroidota bacterium]